MSDDIAGSSPASSASSAAVATPASATVTPASGTPNPISGTTENPNNGTSNEPPRERWDSILSNARDKARREALQPYETFERDPWTAVQNWLSNAEQHSLYGEKVKAYYQSRQQQAQPAQEPAPDVPIVDPNGVVTGYAFSAERQKAWQRWNDQQTQAKYDARLSPIENHLKQQQQERQFQQVQQQAHHEASQTLTALRAQPYFKDHETEIGAALQEHPEWGANVHQAYNHVLVTKILPTLSSAEQASVITSLQQQGAATTVAPSGTTGNRPNFKGDFGKAMAWFSDHPEEAKVMAGRR